MDFYSILIKFNNVSARALGFEPRSKVLETSILPLNYARRIPATPFAADIGKKNFLLETKYLSYILTQVLCKYTLAPQISRSWTGLLVYFRMSVTCPAPTVRPPSRMANFRPFSIAIGWINLTVSEVLSPGITISVPEGSSTSPVTSVVRK
jgi:hypothetical protein